MGHALIKEPSRPAARYFGLNSLTIGPADLALVAIQVFLYGINDYIRSLNIEGTSALYNEIHKSIIQIRAEIHLDFRHDFRLSGGSI